MVQKSTMEQSTRQSQQQYEADGAVLVRQLFSDHDFDDVMDDLETRMQLLAIKQGIDLPCDGGPERIDHLSQCLIALQESCSQSQGFLYDAMSRSPALHRISCHPRICELVSALLGPKFEIHSRLILLMSPPNAKWHLAGWHQDWYYNEGPTSTMTLWIPLHDVDPAGGALRVALGKHREGLMGHSEGEDASTKWNTIQQKYVDRFDDQWDVTAKKGDCLALHSLTPHAGRVNTSDRVRFVLNFRFVDISDPEYLSQGWRKTEITHARASLGKQKSTDSPTV